jgi:hypothetical protein
MVATNGITGDRLISKINTKEYEENYDLIFSLKYCRICGESKNTTEFYRKNARVCKLCANKESIQWQKDNPEKVKRIKRGVKLKEKYNLSIIEYEELLNKQGGSCAICNSLPIRRNLDIDHDHITGKIRGILCESCNKAIGMFKDDIELLNKAINYLKGN